MAMGLGTANKCKLFWLIKMTEIAVKMSLFPFRLKFKGEGAQLGMRVTLFEPLSDINNSVSKVKSTK